MIVFLVGSQQSRVLLISYFMQRSLHFFQRIFLREIIVGVVHTLYIVCGGRHQNDYFIGILYFQLRSVHYRNLSSFILHDQLLRIFQSILPSIPYSLVSADRSRIPRHGNGMTVCRNGFIGMQRFKRNDA